MKLFLLLLSASLVLFSCSNPTERKYTKETVSDDLKAIWEHDKDSTAIKSIIGYMMISAFTKEDLTGKTYKEIIELQQAAKAKIEKAEEEQKILAAKALQEVGERREKLGQVLTVALFDKDFYKEDYQSYLSYGLAFQNKSDKEIRAVKGVLIINDLFDELIKTVNITYDTPIPAMGLKKANFTTEYNQFRDEDQRLNSKNLQDLKVVWNPEKIIYTDGTTLE